MIESHLSPPTESHSLGVFNRGRSDDELRGRQCRNDAGSRVRSRVAGPGVPEMRFSSGTDAECYTSKQRTRSGQYALAAWATHKLPRCNLTPYRRPLSAFLPPCLCVPPHEYVTLEICQCSSELDHHTGCNVVRAPPYLSFARPGDTSAGFARRRPPRFLCCAPLQEAVAEGRGWGPESVVERCLIHMASWRTDSGSKGRCKTWWNGRARTGKHAARMSGIAPLHCRWCMRVLLDLQVALDPVHRMVAALEEAPGLGLETATEYQSPTPNCNPILHR